MIEIGQVYRSNDPRDKGRAVKVIAKAGARHWHVENVESKRRTRISKVRLKATGTRGWKLQGEGAWDNFGTPVSVERLLAGTNALKEMLPAHSARTRFEVLGYFRERIERDEPAVLIAAKPDAAIEILDLTGRYRLLTAMLADGS